MARTAAVWDPAQYLRFANQRLRPALDLLAQVPLEAPARVVDLGCGAGNVTAILRERFPSAEVVGVDGSSSDAGEGARDVSDCRFEQADFFRWEPSRASGPDLSRTPRCNGLTASDAVPPAAVVPCAGRRAGRADAGHVRHAAAADPL